MGGDQEDTAVAREADIAVACEENTEIIVVCGCKCHQPGHGETTSCFACDCEDVTAIWVLPLAEASNSETK